MDARDHLKSNGLSAYRAKRSPDRTPEPFGGGTAGTGHLFVVHKHAARQVHYDLRLEMDGVLRSWAVPKGPSYDPRDRRLAVLVEDHPVEYGDFEGLIPEGNYGAGAVILWDRGEWVPLNDPAEGLAQGKLLFELRGYKLRGAWTLVKIKKGQKEWLLIKERDGYVREDGGELPPESVLSGLTVEALKAGASPASQVRAELERLGAPRRVVAAQAIEPMLAEPRDAAFAKPGWIFELKLDGYRLIAGRDGSDVTLRSRSGAQLGAGFPEIARAVRAIPAERFVLDGELVVLDRAGRPSFQSLQQRARLSRALDVRLASIEQPATYFGFDLLGFEEFDLRGLPLRERKRLLRMLLPPLGPVRFLDHFEGDGDQFLREVGRLGLEGIIAKRADSPYRAGRSPAWLKIRTEKSADFVVVGFTQPRGSRGAIGALHLADYVDGQLTYAGRVGSGLSDRALRELRARLEPERVERPPCEGPRPAGSLDRRPAGSEDWTRALPGLKGSTWVRPVLVCEVRFKEWTEDGLLRQPVLARWRDDKRPEECVRQVVSAPGPGTGGERGEPRGGREAEPAGARRRAPPGPPARPPERTIPFTNLNKVFWPDEGYTKGDLVGYYRGIASWLLPYLKHRPLVLTRFPDGITGKSFYQKDAPDFVPDWIRTVAIWSEDTQREIRYFVCDDLETLLYLVNLGTIPLHLWASRVGSLEQPDWCVLDLDPKEAPFRDAVTIARYLHELCEDAGLPSFVKTTGKTGLHIMIPLGGQCTYEQSRTLGELLARLVVGQLGDIATITRQVARRGAKVYLDYLQNRRGQLTVAPFSVRPLPGAPVSMPLAWKEVNASLDPRRYTIRTALRRMRRLGADPMAEVLREKPDLVGALARLAARAPAPRRAASP